MDVNEEKKQDKKKNTFKVAVTSGICTLLLIIIILLLILFGLKNCSNIHGDHGSYSSGNSGQTYNHERLNTQLLNIVNEERKVSGYEQTPIRVVAVTCTDNYPNSFSISITAVNDTTVYYYDLNNHSYTGDTSSYNNCIEYINKIDISSRLDNTATLSKGETTDDIVSTDKGSKYIIYSTTPNKYFSGFYFLENKYYVYNHVSFSSGDNPFEQAPTLEVDINHPLFGYYQSLNN